MAKYRYVGNYANEVARTDDRRMPVGPGDFIDDVDLDNEDNKVLMESGMLVSVEDLMPAPDAATNKDAVGKENDEVGNTDVAASTVVAPTTPVTSDAGGDQ